MEILTLHQPRAAAAIPPGRQFGLGGKSADEEVARVARRQKRPKAISRPLAARMVCRADRAAAATFGLCRGRGRGGERLALGRAIGGDGRSSSRGCRIGGRSLPHHRGGMGRRQLVAVGRPGRRQLATSKRPLTSAPPPWRWSRRPAARVALSPMELVQQRLHMDLRRDHPPCPDRVDRLRSRDLVVEASSAVVPRFLPAESRLRK